MTPSSPRRHSPPSRPRPDRAAVNRSGRTSSITGGSDGEQRRDGDYLSKDERYDRTDEYLDIMKQAWTSPAPFGYHGRYYQVEDSLAEVRSAGNSTALVGTPETVAQALLDYVDIGVSTLLIRGYDPYDDAIDYGRHLLPLVRAEVARRDRRPCCAGP
jgi:alkanesulfonate monooxygenase SsuD/methylene tetrahydromethanopterin reductase-like flavin-dependent oxidoreductase (luciferase family)